MSLYSIVVPVYNSEHTLEELYTRIKNTFDNTINEPFELILVDDGSKDKSFEKMQELRERDRRVKIVQMAKNFGQHPALLCGFSFVKGDFVITMDDDLQHPPEEIPKLINVMNERDDVDVIIAKYEGRHHGLIRRLGTRLSVYATSKMLHKDKDLEITSFRLIRRFIVDAILGMNVRLPQIGNLLVSTSNRIINVPVKHDARKYGKSGYTFSHLVHELVHDIISNSAFPLIVIRDLGIISFIISIILAIYYLIKYFTLGTPVEGFTTLVLLITAFSGLILLGIGVIGQYLMNILDEARKMPNYTIRKKDID
ncbi:MAG TPA: glycosyltransferase family 2 protein [Candidatus Alectryocaccobium stercorigallinarum]|jgi:glycosyltransferase involved in cell wall biosynthesis|nr:glycosyltransferase family 2 protein [Candidatus Alectryocaccobium stercorigallinarum]